MGLTSYKGGRVRKGDVGAAKNYLRPEEISTLNRITVMFLDQAQFRAERRTDIRMADWDAFLAKFLRDNELPALEGFGTVSREDGARHAEEQYARFAARRQEEDDKAAEAAVKLLETGKKAAKRSRG